MLVKKDVLIFNGQKLVQGMQVHKQLMLQIMTERIRNIKQYLLATLYNAPVTVDSYYSAQVRREFGWGGRVDKN